MNKLLTTLISIPSVSGQESAIQQFIEEYLVRLGFTPSRIGENIVLCIPGMDHAKALIFDAHVDIVAPGDISKWNHDPFAGKEDSGRIYGLGASDEKATVAVLFSLAERYAQSPPECDIYLFFVVREELDGSGTQEVLSWFSHGKQQQYSKLAGILGEPTDLAHVQIAHKGNLFLRVTTSGDTGHGSNPQGIQSHAVRNMMRVADTLEELGNIWIAKYTDSTLGSPTIGALTSIVAGTPTSPNKFPDTCVATFDIRTTPTLHPNVLKEITAAIPEAVIEPVYAPVGVGWTNPEAHIVKIIQAITGAEIVVAPGATDQCFFTEHGIDAVIYGPGVEKMMHQTDEYCVLAALPQCVREYESLVAAFAAT